MKALLFDIDGTLVNAGSAARNAFHRAFKELFDVAPNDQGVSMAGRTDQWILKRILQQTFGSDVMDTHIEAINDKYFSYLPGFLAEDAGYQLLVGVSTLLDRLAQNDSVVLGLQTGNSETSGYMKLAQGGIDHFFSFGGFGSDSQQREDLVAVACNRAQAAASGKITEFIVIGDTPFDIRAGKFNDCQTVAVSTGSFSEAELDVEQPDLIFTDFSDTDLVLSKFGLFC